jgi:isopentenyldiphosphate isomerase
MMRFMIMNDALAASLLQGEWDLCPVCCARIKRVLKHTGDEVAEYNRWLHASSKVAVLPQSFVRRWKQSSVVLRRRCVSAEEVARDASEIVVDDEERQICSCRIA